MADPRYVNLTAPAGGYESQLADIKRRQKMAELLAQQGGEDIKVESVNGVPTPISPFQGLAKALQSGMGGYLAGKAAEEEAALEESENKAIADVFEGMKDTPDIVEPSVIKQDSETEGGPGAFTTGKITPGQKLSPSEKTNRLMAALIKYPKIATVAPMYMQGMRNELEDTRYATGQERLDKQETDRLEQQRLTNERNVKNDLFAQQEAARDNARAAQAQRDAMQARSDALEAAVEARKTARDQILFDRKTAIENKPETQYQADSAGYADRMIAANSKLDDPEMMAAGTSLAQQGRSGIPLIGNYLTSSAKKSYDQGVLSFVNAKLRRESGATIGDPEFIKAEKQYFPQPGDERDPKIIEQKALERKIAIDGMVRSAGPGYKRFVDEAKRLADLEAKERD